MRRLSPWYIVCAALVLSHAASAQLADVEFSYARKKLAEQTAHDARAHSTKTTDSYVYTVTVQSKSFQAIKDLQVKYMIFYKDAKRGSREAPMTVSFSGAQPFPLLESNGTVTFETKPLQIVKNEQDAGWVYTSGASGRADSQIVGVWFRAYSGGKMLGELCNPDTLANQESWKD